MGYIGGSTKCEIRLFPSETWASGNQRTVKITFDAKVKGGSDSWFGYAVDYRVWVHGQASGWNRLKGTETWRGNNDRRSFSQSLTVDVGTSNSTSVRVGVELKCKDASWNGSYMENFTVSQTNVAPTTPGWIQVKNGGYNGAVLSGTISENITNFYVDWGASSDANGDTITYILQEERNENGSWSTIDTGTDTAHQFNTVGGEGTTYKYSVVARDGRGGESAWRTSAAITKNVFTMATLACNSSVSYQGSPLYFTYSGGSNTQSGVSVRYKLKCENIPVYNGDWFTTGTNVFINWGQGGGITNGPYINWNDIKNLFSKPEYQGKGNLTFVLEGTNSNGTVKTSRVSVPVNIQHEPGAFSTYISTSPSESTAYKQVADTKNWYFIPDGSRVVRVKWNAATGSMGEAVKYRVYVAYNSGGWTELATTTSLYYNHVVPKQTSSQQFKYKVRAISTYNEGQYTEAQTSAQTLHYYNGVSLTKGNITRTATSAEVQITVKSSTSIPSVNTRGSWSCNGRSGSLSATQNQQALVVSGLTESGTYTMSITYNDGTGFSSDKSETVSIGANLPIFYVNKYGAGVGGAKAESGKNLSVKGKTYTDTLEVGTTTGKSCDSAASDELIITSTTSASRPENYCLVRGLGKNNTYGLQIASYYGGSNRFYLRGTHDYNAQWKDWARVYTDKDKPSAVEIGALSLEGGYVAGEVHINSKSGRNLGYMGRGSDVNNFFCLRSTNSVMELRTPYRGGNGPVYLDTNGYLRPGSNNDWSLGANDFRWSTVYYSNLSAASDGRLKENIKYLTREADTLDLEDKADLTHMDLYNFVKDDLNIATYDYIERKQEDEDKSKNKIGFIAQDIVDTKVGSKLIKKDKVEAETALFKEGDETLSYDLTDYVNILAGALKTAINEIEVLKEKITELEAK